MNIKRFALRRREQFVDLSLFLDKILCHLRVYHLAIAERLGDIFTHLLLFEVVLPVFYFEVLLVDLVQHHIHFLLLAQI